MENGGLMEELCMQIENVSQILHEGPVDFARMMRGP